ncbi:MAG: AAA family ATPase [Treponema sp.]|jgi:predicted AAA+ superfamily ATPase|nr:AAA family ATPase [Treponema sp.]
MRRSRATRILGDLETSVVFLGGPRRVGKTWLAHDIAREFARPVYLSYDSPGDRKTMQKQRWPGSADLLVLDEIHKMPGWKSYLHGVFGAGPAKPRVLAAGIARLGYSRQAGDPFPGRFSRHRLFPFSPGELSAAGVAPDIDRLMRRGGFPEPFLEGEAFARLWRGQYVGRLIHEDALDIEKFSDFKSLKLCLELLRGRVGSPVSYASIAREVGIAPNTARKYVRVFEELCVVFRVAPFAGDSKHGGIARSLLKEPKIYFYDTALVEGGDGARLENLTALSLAKQAAYDEDVRGVPAALCYIRTKDSREVDFCYVRGGAAQFLAEAAMSEPGVGKDLRYFCDRHGIPGIQLVKDLKQERREGNIEVRSAGAWLAGLE